MYGTTWFHRSALYTLADLEEARWMAGHPDAFDLVCSGQLLSVFRVNASVLEKSQIL
jgi:hypothetical protein